jgi:hypothetical protein
LRGSSSPARVVFSEEAAAPLLEMGLEPETHLHDGFNLRVFVIGES